MTEPARVEASCRIEPLGRNLLSDNGLKTSENYFGECAGCSIKVGLAHETTILLDHHPASG
jgi:hypothetical protein